MIEIIKHSEEESSEHIYREKKPVVKEILKLRNTGNPMMEPDRGIYVKGEGSDGACFSLKRKERVLSSSGAEGQEKRVKL